MAGKPSRASLEFEKAKARTGVPGYAKKRTSKGKDDSGSDSDSTAEHKAKRSPAKPKARVSGLPLAAKPAPSRESLEFEKAKARTGVPGYAKPKKKMSLAEEDESTMEYRAGHEDMPFVNKAPRRKGQDPASLDPFAHVTKRKPRKSK